MQRREFLATAGTAIAAAAGQPTVSAAAESAPDRRSCDTFVYGSTPGGIAAAIEAGAKGYILKPVKQEKLAETLETVAAKYL